MRYLLCLFLLMSPPVQAVEVDVELVLMVDVSRSMRPGELEVQRKGYAEAIRSDEVVNAVLNSFTGSIALVYVEWAGSTAQRVIVPWTLVDSRDVAEDIARQLEASETFGLRRTSISGAIAYAMHEIETNEFDGLRQVIDISGDGPNNEGLPVVQARDDAVAKGVVINGLPLMTREGNSFWMLDDLDAYYQDCVVGGPGAFVIPVRDWSEFPMAVRRKIVLELAGPAASVWSTRSGNGAGGYDCLIGEKMRRERELMGDDF